MARDEADARKIRQLMQELGQAARGPGRIYFTGGATALLHGWRETTVDADLKLDPEPEGIFEAIRRLKDRLSINIELACPADFIPPVPGWREGSGFICQIGLVSFYHYDLRAQALAKIERGHTRDLADVRAMLERELVTRAEIAAAYQAIEPQLDRYPAIDADAFREKVEEFLAGRGSDE